jgi:hypothetical protein
MDHQDETLWHKCSGAPPFFKVIGERGCGQMWRRKINGVWEFKQDEETADQFYERVW